MEITFSVNHTATLVYAYAALDRVNGECDAFIDILSPDRYEALSKVIRSTFSELALKLMPAVVSLDAGDADDIVKVGFAGSVSGALAGAVRPLLERWAALNTLAVIHISEASGSVASRFSALAAEALTPVREMIADVGVTGTVMPCNY